MSDYLVVFFVKMNDSDGFGVASVIASNEKGVTMEMLDRCEEQLLKDRSNVMKAVPVNVIHLDEPKE